MRRKTYVKLVSLLLSLAVLIPAIPAKVSATQTTSVVLDRNFLVDHYTASGTSRLRVSQDRDAALYTGTQTVSDWSGVRYYFPSALDTSEYKYFVIKYKTSSANAHISLLRSTTDSEGHAISGRTVNGQITTTTDGEWHTAIVNMDNVLFDGNSYSAGYTWGIGNINYINLLPWGWNSVQGEEFYVQYMGFFTTESEAKLYAYEPAVFDTDSLVNDYNANGTVRLSVSQSGNAALYTGTQTVSDWSGTRYYFPTTLDTSTYKYFLIKYKTSSSNAHISLSRATTDSAGHTVSGRTVNGQISTVTDGEWHTEIVNLDNALFDGNSYSVGYTWGAGNLSCINILPWGWNSIQGEEFYIEYMGFFTSQADASEYAATAEYLTTINESATTMKTAILNNTDTPAYSGTAYYISPTGDDSNSGTSPSSAWRTINKVNSYTLSSGDAVLFERGQVFRGRVLAQNGVTYSAYGAGEKPKIYGSPMNGADPSLWTLMPGTTNIWVYAYQYTDVGTIVFNNGEEYAVKENPDYKNGAYYVRGTDTLFNIQAELNRNLEFFCSAESVLNSSGVPDVSNPSCVGTIYLRCDNGNPGSVYNSIEFNTYNMPGALYNTYGHIIYVPGNVNNVTIDNLCLKYGGAHGVGAGDNDSLTVQNCEIGWIGGCINNYDTTNGKVTRFGNGVEETRSCHNYTVSNNWIYQCYDAGITNQTRATGGLYREQYGISYTNNLIESCTYSIEYFFETDASTDPNCYMGDFEISGNIMRYAGCGFGYYRPNPGWSSHIMGQNSQNPSNNFVIENNIFDRSMDNIMTCVAADTSNLPTISNNTYIQKTRGQFGKYGLRSTAATLPKYDILYDANIRSTISGIVGDTNASVGYFYGELPE